MGVIFTKAADVAEAPATGDLYQGDIGFRALAVAPATKQLDVYTVRFAAGARNRMHRHLHDQVLIATQGRGVIADADGERIMEVGDHALIPAGTPHWHGAAIDSDFVHIAIAVPGDRIEILD